MSPVKRGIDSRSDKVRARRQVQIKNRTTRTSQYTRGESNKQPFITTRGTYSAPYGNPIVNRAANNRSRRQYSFAVDSGRMKQASGINIPGFYFGWRLLSGVLSVFFICVLMLMTNHKQFTVSQPKLIGFEKITPADLEAAIHLSYQSIYEVDPVTVSKDLQAAFPELSDISVMVGFPANVIITAKERQPVIAWQMPSGTSWIDTEGYVFNAREDVQLPLTISADGPPPLQTEEITEDPKTTGPLEEQVKKQAKADMQILKAAQILREQLGSETTIIYQQINGLGWSDSRGWNVYIGNNLRNLETKVTMYNSIVNKLIAEGTQPTVVSLQYMDVPYYHVEQ